MSNEVAVPCTINYLRDDGDIFIQIPAARGDNTVAWVGKEYLVIARQKPTGQQMKGFVRGWLLGQFGADCSVSIDQRGAPLTLLLPQEEVISDAALAALLAP